MSQIIRIAFLLVLWCIIGVGSVALAGDDKPPFAQQVKERHLLESSAADSNPSELVHPELIANTTAIEPGKPFKLAVRLTMKPHWHTYYKESGEAGMPTRIKWELPAGFTAGELEWQKPHKFNDSGIITYGYADSTVIGATITPPASLPAGQPVAIKAGVKWLSCSDQCVPGQSEVDLSLPVATAANPAAPANEKEFATLGFSGSVKDLSEDAGEKKTPAAAATPGGPGSVNILDSTLKIDGKTAAPQDANSVFQYLPLAFLGGFILNFMPCVLPVISIKVFSFMQQAGEDPKRVLQLGLAFTAGIISSFMLIAFLVLGIKAAGQQIGWGVQFQYPVFLLVLSTIVLVFALSMFGLFYIQVTAGQDEVDKLASKEGFTGTFFKGVLATILSTPCTAPALGTALGFAFGQPGWVILLVFLTVALGMSFPYVLLTANPGWMKYLPKPGVWMEKFKEGMGFLMLGTVVWLVWVLNRQVGVNAGMSAVAFLTVVSFAVWVIGKFTDLTSTQAHKIKIYGLALVLVGAGYIIFLAPNPQLLSTNPALAAGTSAPMPAEINSSVGIDWQPFTIDRLNQELSANKTVLVDFTADWCLTCKVNESTVLNTTPVAEKLKALQVVTLRADWTRQDPKISELLSKFGRSGVPLYVIFPAGKSNEPIVLPEVITQPMVLEKLDQAGASK